MKRGLSRRDFMRLTGLAAAGGFVSSQSRLLAALSSGAALQTGGAVVMPIGTEPEGLDTCNPWGLGSALWGMTNLLYDSWWLYDRSMNIVPSAAADWTRPDETTVVVNIRPGIKFHGRPTLTSAAPGPASTSSTSNRSARPVSTSSRSR